MAQRAAIPGRLNPAKLMNVLVQEEADETVGEIVDEQMSKVMAGCLTVDMERQLASFSASWAVSYLTRILEQQIMCPDEGEGPREASKTEDSEPLPATADAWAQGCAPASPQSCPAAAQREADIVQVPAQPEPRVNQQCNGIAQTDSSLKSSDKETSGWRPVNKKKCRVPCPRSTPKIDLKKRQQVNLPPKLIPGKLLPVLPCPAIKKDVEVEDKNRVYCLYNHMTGPLYQPKDYQPIPRLDPSRLPRHCILPQYEIVDNNYTNANPKTLSGLSKIEPKCKQRPTERAAAALTPLTSSMDWPAKFLRRNEEEVALKKLSPSRRDQEGMEFSRSLRLDTMVLAKGVSIWDPRANEGIPLKLNSPSQSTKLGPIRSDTAVSLPSLVPLSAGGPPKVTAPLFQSKNSL
ncbi:uncharacterized protein C2orf81 homolog isoform X1 [Scophthalmus maximus]|uniref:uncharacterized protein C2orf81 homolog isoform X1 n=2 Tax=Scophthalmus maximus TaxID=52904 RepID=UPI001FA85596|nr:uncharacterized protein C2orf81 homolog isoform X1 [Scophthalmus maximus]XP_035495511.2 uncharacterized protein C2orf81 homolog isoform X1 [Scophthalmus maximus]XP_035495513.2 uncharacterized protein C2orf81 homolog isoform X1 [Scophthalmus maximus]XP_035495514.2 uncharacterized protein C2orf81 homolog isoform X1 [Scophthalmus maximus]XP_035495515.2 uncharacterized protein C2orf81 homolog isoform X1 [Scophthalmus maximus]